MKTIFVGPNGIRAGWRFAIFVFLLFGLSKLFFWTLTTFLHYQEPDGWFAKNFTIEGALSLGAALLAAWIMSKIECRPFQEYGLTRSGAFGRHDCPAFSLGNDQGGRSGAPRPRATERGLLVGACVSVAWLRRRVRIPRVFAGNARARDGLLACRHPAIWHLWSDPYVFKPMENWMDALSVGLFGLFWSFTLWRTGTLWFAIGFHAMSDYADMVIFAQPNTGNHGESLTGHFLNVTYRGPDWLTGGPRGTEASVLEFLILAMMFMVFARAYPRVEKRA